MTYETLKPSDYWREKVVSGPRPDPASAVLAVALVALLLV